jgi:hypothetical protein
MEDLFEPDEDMNSEDPACTGDPFTCPCESCQAFRRDVEADRAGESDDGRAAA